MTVRFEVGFISAYALVLLAVAWGLWRLGRLNNNPWSSRLFAAYRRDAPDVPRPDLTDWPHAEAPRVYTGLGLVAAVAATSLCGAEALRHHAPAELAVLAVVGALGGLSVARLARRLGVREAARG